MFFFVNRKLFKHALNKNIQIQKLNLSHQAKLMDLKVPGFKVDSKNVFIMLEPTEFHNKILDLITLSSKRIVLSSLYIGTGELEKKLVNHLHHQLKRKPQLKANILLDYNRGNREDKNGQSSKTLLLPLLNESSTNSSTKSDQEISNKVFMKETNKISSNLSASSTEKTLRPSIKQDSKVSINFFLSPDFSNIFLKNILLRRQKFNEIISLQHIKVYLFDDDFIISGANLNEQYFTNRQDRYIYIKNSPQLADYLEKLIQIISDISMHLNPDGTFSFELDPLDKRKNKVIKFKLKNEIENLNKIYFNHYLEIENKDEVMDSTDKNKTIIYPLIQMKKFNINSDEKFCKFIFNNLTDKSKLYLASGYFNLTQDYQKSIFKTISKEPDCSVELIMASEQVNSFYKAKGPLQYIPSIYTQLSRNFLKNLNSSMLKNIKLLSYFKSNWTFHSKGLWLSSNSSTEYFLSLIGSPNFGYRSVYKDLELQLAILTKDDDLIKKFFNEYENVKKYSILINTPDQLPFVSYWIRIVTKFIKSFFLKVICKINN